MPTIQGKEVGEYGFGLMGFSWRPNQTPYEKAFKTMRAALAKGANFWDGGEIYGQPDSNSLHLLRAYFEKFPEDADKVFINIKGCIAPGLKPDSSPEGVRRSVENCVNLLGGVKKLDSFEAARVDPNTPIEETMKAFAELIKEGKLGGVSLSEASADTIRRAAKIVKIDSVELEVSLFSLDIWENGIAETCAELDIPIIAYSPLGRGLLTGQVRKRSDIPEGDMRLNLPRFNEENFSENFKLVEKVEAIAKKKGSTPGQVALAWVAQSGGKAGQPTIIPIPGATTTARAEENLTKITLDEAEFSELNEFTKRFVVKGDRYHPHGMTMVHK